MKFVDGETTVGKINWLSRYVILHSVLYYSLSTSMVSDFEFDTEAKSLYKFITDYPEEFKMSKYYEILKDFTGCTG